MKQRFSLVFILALILTIVAACGADEKSEGTSSGKETVVIGIDDTFAPMGFRDDNNEIVGFDIDLATAAAEHMGVDVEFQPIDWSTKESELSSGRIDLIWNGYTVTEERKEKVLFTKPYLENAQVVMTLADSEIATLNDLANKEVGIQALSSALDALNANPISEEVTLNEYKDNVLALTDLQAKRVEAVVIDKVVGEYFMTQQADTFKILDETLAPEQYAVGVKKGNEELLNKVQAALDAMNEDGTSAEISTKWFGEDIVIK